MVDIEDEEEDLHYEIAYNRTSNVYFVYKKDQTNLRDPTEGVDWVTYPTNTSIKEPTISYQTGQDLEDEEIEINVIQSSENSDYKGNSAQQSRDNLVKNLMAKTEDILFSDLEKQPDTCKRIKTVSDYEKEFQEMVEQENDMRKAEQSNSQLDVEQSADSFGNLNSLNALNTAINNYYYNNMKSPNQEVSVDSQEEKPRVNTYSNTKVPSNLTNQNDMELFFSSQKIEKYTEQIEPISEDYSNEGSKEEKVKNLSESEVIYSSKPNIINYCSDYRIDNSTRDGHAPAQSTPEIIHSSGTQYRYHGDHNNSSYKSNERTPKSQYHNQTNQPIPRYQEQQMVYTQALSHPKSPRPQDQKIIYTQAQSQPKSPRPYEQNIVYTQAYPQSPRYQEQHTVQHNSHPPPHQSQPVYAQSSGNISPRPAQPEPNKVISRAEYEEILKKQDQQKYERQHQQPQVVYQQGPSYQQQRQQIKHQKQDQIYEKPKPREYCQNPKTPIQIPAQRNEQFSVSVESQDAEEINFMGYTDNSAENIEILHSDNSTGRNSNTGKIIRYSIPESQTQHQVNRYQNDDLRQSQNSCKPYIPAEDYYS